MRSAVGPRRLNMGEIANRPTYASSATAFIHLRCVGAQSRPSDENAPGHRIPRYARPPRDPAAPGRLPVDLARQISGQTEPRARHVLADVRTPPSRPGLISPMRRECARHLYRAIGHRPGPCSRDIRPDNASFSSTYVSLSLYGARAASVLVAPRLRWFR